MKEILTNTIHGLLSGKKGILAADESPKTLEKRFKKINLQSTENNRKIYREMLFSSKNAIVNYISGIIFHDETLREKTSNNFFLKKIIQETSIIPGIKVDSGIRSLPFSSEEFITEGLDGLNERLMEYLQYGVRFSKWRSVFSIDEKRLPTSTAIKYNVYTLSLYASISQKLGIVPIVEPEVVMDGFPGTHSIDRCYNVTKYVLGELFSALRDANVNLNGILLKINMIIDGKNKRQASKEEIAEKTINCLKDTVPSSVPGIAFLSGGQSDKEATENLASIVSYSKLLPWNITFSYGRALQSSAISAWNGKKENTHLFQDIFFHRAQMNCYAIRRCWSQEKELEKEILYKKQNSI